VNLYKSKLIVITVNDENPNQCGKCRWIQANICLLYRKVIDGNRLEECLKEFEIKEEYDTSNSK